MSKEFLKNFHLSFFNELINYIKKKNIPVNRKKYLKGEVISSPLDICDKIGIIMSGRLEIKHFLSDGKIVTINTLSKYDIFGEILLFSHEQNYPYYLISSHCDILFIKKSTLLSILHDNILLLESFLYHISNSYMHLNKYIKLKAQKTLRYKLAFYFLNYGKLTSENTTILIKTKTALAEFLGVERESLLRELSILRKDKKLHFDQKAIYIDDYYYFKELID